VLSWPTTLRASTRHGLHCPRPARRAFAGPKTILFGPAAASRISQQRSPRPVAPTHAAGAGGNRVGTPPPVPLLARRPQPGGIGAVVDTCRPRRRGRPALPQRGAAAPLCRPILSPADLRALSAGGVPSARHHDAFAGPPMGSPPGALGGGPGTSRHSNSALAASPPRPGLASL